ncbi:MAG: hypothetical protein H6701_02745 [Myxococcales bacterium]|nr:hypothetical protein [Myxococcales bacterium]MCB9552875.1 hypothetical protein [Myxococcales bacterium]
MTATRALALLITLALAGCGGAAPAWDVGRDGAADFADARDTWTRHAAAYEGFEGRLFAHATWYTPSFAAALAARRADTDGATPSERRDAIDAAVEAARNELRFFVAVATRDPYWNDLARADATLRVRLRAGDAWLDPIRVERVSLDQMADRSVIFPYATPLTEGYDVVFPKPADVERVQLRITGLPARADLVWQTR